MWPAATAEGSQSQRSSVDAEFHDAAASWGDGNGTVNPVSFSATTSRSATPSMSPPTTAGSGTPRSLETKSISRRRKLDGLRKEMDQAFSGNDDPEAVSSQFLRPVAEDASERTSLSSWGHQFLVHSAHDMTSRMVVQAADTQSTRASMGPASGSTMSAPAATTAVRKSPPEPAPLVPPPSIPPPPAGGHLPIRYAPVKPTTPSTSSNSSKSATLQSQDRVPTISPSARHRVPSFGDSQSPFHDIKALCPTSTTSSKSSSLDRAFSVQQQARLQTLTSSPLFGLEPGQRKSHSLTRDLSASDAMFSFDSSHADLVIDQITQSLVSDSHSSLGAADADDDVVLQVQEYRPDALNVMSGSGSAGKLAPVAEVTTPEPVAAALEASTSSTPDIIASNTVRDAQAAIAAAGELGPSTSTPVDTTAPSAYSTAGDSTLVNSSDTCTDDDSSTVVQVHRPVAPPRRNSRRQQQQQRRASPSPPPCSSSTAAGPSDTPQYAAFPDRVAQVPQSQSEPIQLAPTVTNTQRQRLLSRIVEGAAAKLQSMPDPWNKARSLPIRADLSLKSRRDHHRDECRQQQQQPPHSSSDLDLPLALEPTAETAAPFNNINMDPISLQAMRRMSLKRNAKFGDRRASQSSNCSSVLDFEDRQSTSSSQRTGATGSIFKHAGSRAGDSVRQMGRTMSRTMQRLRNTAKQAAEGVSSKLHGGAAVDTSSMGSMDEDDALLAADTTSIVRARHAKKGPWDFEQLRLTQKIEGEHTGAIWCVKFSLCGRLMATGGQDNMVRVWVLKDHFEYFAAMRDKYNLETNKAVSADTSANISDTIMSLNVLDMQPDAAKLQSRVSSEMPESAGSSSGNFDHVETVSRSSASTAEETWSPFMPKPFVSYRGHTADVLDLSWSKSYFILSSSMDSTVRLWHISRSECLCVFQHVDFVTCVIFLPKDDRYFLSGSFDGKLRLWHIPDKKVALWNEVDQKQGARLITALAIVKNGKFAVVGTFDGRCVFYTTEQLKYHTAIDVRSTRGKNSRGRKVTGLGVHGDKLLVTTNDSRVRLYDLRDLSLTCKYKGASNQCSQIKANFSPSGKHIICGSEDNYVYIWRTALDSMQFSVRKDKNAMWERIRGHASIVTGALFAPKPELIFEQVERAKARSEQQAVASGTQSARRNVTRGSIVDSAVLPLAIGTSSNQGSPSAIAAGRGRRSSAAVSAPGSRVYTGDVLVSVDFTGRIFVYVNRTRLRTTGASTFFE